MVAVGWGRGVALVRAFMVVWEMCEEVRGGGLFGE